MTGYNIGYVETWAGRDSNPHHSGGVSRIFHFFSLAELACATSVEISPAKPSFSAFISPEQVAANSLVVSSRV